MLFKGLTGIGGTSGGVAAFSGGKAEISENRLNKWAELAVERIHLLKFRQVKFRKD